MHAMKFLALKISIVSLLVGMLVGCSANLADIAAKVQDIKTKQGDSEQHLTSLIIDEPAGASLGEPTDPEQSGTSASDSPTQTVKHTPAYPQRTNPFEFAVEVDFGEKTSAEDTSQELKLFGFAGNDHPKAIIHIGQTTRLMAQGDRWGDIELLEISPPEVRIRSNGVIRIWSLLGHDTASK